MHDSENKLIFLRLPRQIFTTHYDINNSSRGHRIVILKVISPRTSTIHATNVKPRMTEKSGVSSQRQGLYSP